MSQTLRFEEVVDYGARPEKIYGIMIYPDTLPDLDADVVYWQPDELPPRVGTLTRFKLKVLGVPTFVEIVGRFTDVDPPRRFAVEGIKPWFAKGRWTIDLDALPAGGTRSTTTFELTVGRWAVPIGRVVLALVHRGVRRGTTALLRKLGPPSGGLRS